MYVLMPVPELKTGEIDWNDPNMVEKAKDVIYNKLETIEALKIYVRMLYLKQYLHRLILRVVIMPNSAQHLDLCQHLHKVIIIDHQMYQEIIKTYTLRGKYAPWCGVLIVLTSAKITAEAMLEDIEHGK